MRLKPLILSLFVIPIATLCVSCGEKEDANRLVGTVWEADNGFQYLRIEFTTGNAGVFNNVVESENINSSFHFTYSLERNGGKIYGIEIESDEYPNGIPFAISTDGDCLFFLNIKLTRV